jgi:hypothetical protein
MNLIHTLIFCLFKIHFLIILPFDFRGFVHHSIIHTELANRMPQCIKIYYSMFIWSSTCFERHTAHYQELKTALAASGLAYVKGCWTLWLLDAVSDQQPQRSTTWRSWLRHCATSRKIAGLISDRVVRIFQWPNLSGRTMALRWTQPLTEMSTRNIYWGAKGGRCVGLTNLPPSCADCLEIWESQPPWTFRACPGL